MSKNSSAHEKLKYPKLSRKAVLDLLASTHSPMRYKDIRNIFGLDDAQAKGKLRPFIRKLQRQNLISFANGSYKASRPLSPVMMVKAFETQDGIELEPLHWDVRNIQKPFLFLDKKSRKSEAANIKQGDILLVQLNHRSTMKSGGMILPTVICRVVRNLRNNPEQTLTGIFGKRATHHFVKFRDSGRIRAEFALADTEGILTKDDYPEGALVNFHLNSHASQHRPKIIVTGLTHWSPTLPARLLSTISTRAHGFKEADYSELTQKKIRTIARKTMAHPDAEDRRTQIYHAVDPRDAKDRDDAISAWPDPDPDNPGGIILSVAIVNAARLVAQSHEVFENILRNGFSGYPGNRALHLLPREWAESAASFVDGQDRSCLIRDIKLSTNGHIISSTLTQGIVSAKTHSYEEFDNLFDKARDHIENNQNTDQTLFYLLAAHTALQKEDIRRDRLNFLQNHYYSEISEVGHITGFHAESESLSRDIIKKAMIAHNQTFIEEMEHRGLSFIGRIEEAPAPDGRKFLQKLDRIRHIMPIRPQSLDRASLKSLFESLEYDSLRVLAAQRFVIEYAMKPGKYEVNGVGHFGLGFVNTPYGTASSPVRSLPDLINQMAMCLENGWLDDVIDQGLKDRLRKTITDKPTLEGICAHLNEEQPKYKKLQRDTQRLEALAYINRFKGKEVSVYIMDIDDEHIHLQIEDCAYIFRIPLHDFKRQGVQHDLINQMLKYYGGRQIAAGQWTTLLLQSADPLTDEMRLAIPAKQHDITSIPIKNHGNEKSYLVKILIREATNKSLKISINGHELDDVRSLLPGSTQTRSNSLYHFNSRIYLRENTTLTATLTIDRHDKISEIWPGRKPSVKNAQSMDAEKFLTKVLRIKPPKEPTPQEKTLTRKDWLGLLTELNLGD